MTQTVKKSDVVFLNSSYICMPSACSNCPQASIRGCHPSPNSSLLTLWLLHHHQHHQVVETYSEELGLGKSDSRQCHAALAARGPKKLAALVAAVRTVQFMDR